MFSVVRTSATSRARLGMLHTAHGSFPTPMFMPVGTRGAVKGVTAAQLREVGASIILGNTYHLMLRPGAALVEHAGGLQQFTGWQGPMLTDSGGFQVFSLASLNTVSDAGVRFVSHIDGARLFLGPQESMALQKSLGADIVMAFDQCPPADASFDVVRTAVDRTQRWARICRDYSLAPHQHLFGIVQGGIFPELRKASVEALLPLDFDGYAIGGLSVGESTKQMYEVLDYVPSWLPQDKPRYLMGVGTPRNLLEGVLRGVDLFDCVMPSRNARGGTAFTWSGKIQIKAARYKEDHSPLDPDLDAYPSSFSKAYIRHLYNVGEMTGITLVTMQNIAFYLDFMRQLREAIEQETLDLFRKKVDAAYRE